MASRTASRKRRQERKHRIERDHAREEREAIESEHRENTGIVSSVDDSTTDDAVSDTAGNVDNASTVGTMDGSADNHAARKPSSSSIASQLNLKMEERARALREKNPENENDNSGNGSVGKRGSSRGRSVSRRRFGMIAARVLAVIAVVSIMVALAIPSLLAL